MAAATRGTLLLSLLVSTASVGLNCAADRSEVHPAEGEPLHNHGNIYYLLLMPDIVICSEVTVKGGTSVQ